MNIPAQTLPVELLTAAVAAWLLVLAQAIRRAPWGRMRRSREQHTFLGATLALTAFWTLGGRMAPEIGLHFLGLTVYTLMFGWSLSVIGASIAALGFVLTGSGGFETVPLNAVVLGVVPISVSFSVYALVHCYLPRHIFVYIYGCAFFGAIISSAAAICLLVVVLTAAEVYPYGLIASEYLPYVALYLFAEGVLNGILTTMLIGVRPHWLFTYDDELYLRGK